MVTRFLFHGWAQGNLLFLFKPLNKWNGYGKPPLIYDLIWPLWNPNLQHDLLHHENGTFIMAKTVQKMLWFHWNNEKNYHFFNISYQVFWMLWRSLQLALVFVADISQLCFGFVTLVFGWLCQTFAIFFSHPRKQNWNKQLYLIFCFYKLKTLSKTGTVSQYIRTFNKIMIVSLL